MWLTTDVPEASTASLHALVDGQVPAVRMSGFASPDETVALRDAMDAMTVRTSSISTVTRLGISQYEQGLRGSKEDYFAQAAELVPVFERAFVSSFSPLERFLSSLRSLGIDADIMTEPGFGPYWAGNGKLRIGRTPLHVDFAPQDSAGWAVHAAHAQLAWNLYLSDPDGQGHLLLWDKEWRPEDDSKQIQGEYFHDMSVVDGVRHVEVPTVVGDVVIINSRNYHRVADAQGRLSYGSFVSVLEGERFRLWS